jgi:hypothetical protein
MIRACLFALAAATSLFSAPSVWAQAQQIPSFTIIQNQDRTFTPGLELDEIIVFIHGG